MVKDDSLYIVAIVAVVAVVGLLIMATGSSSTVMVAEDLPSMAEESDSTAIAGQAVRIGSIESIESIKPKIGEYYGYGDPKESPWEKEEVESLFDRGYGITTDSTDKITAGTVEILNSADLTAEIIDIFDENGITWTGYFTISLTAIEKLGGKELSEQITDILNEKGINWVDDLLITISANAGNSLTERDISITDVASMPGYNVDND